jgi:hypothetical protein
MAESRSGRCLCGAIRFEIDLPVKWCAHCHCHLCRRAHGAAFVTWFGVEDDGFRIVAGSEHLRWYRSTPEAERGFCSSCGSTMLFRSSRWADEMHVALPFVDGDIGRPPTAHVYWDRHVDWVELGDELRRLGGETGTEPLE